MNEHSRLRWRCRRGIREMDILLQGFLDSVYPGLPENEQLAFERLIEETDLDLLDWITGRQPAVPAGYEPLINRLRHLHVSRGT